MSKFFTSPLGLLLALVGVSLASDKMTAAPAPLPGLEAVDPETRPGQDLPAVLDAGRFAPLGKKSPFTLASVSEENADFAKDLILAGYVRMSGKDFVIIANRNGPERLMVGTQASPGALGMILVKLEKDPSGDPTKLRAQIRKGDELATLQYATATPSSPAVPTTIANSPVGQAAPGLVPSPGQALPPGQSAPGQVQNPTAGSPASPTNMVIRRRSSPIPLPSK